MLGFTQKAPARLGFPGALPQRRVVWMWFGAFPLPQPPCTRGKPGVGAGGISPSFHPQPNVSVQIRSVAQSCPTLCDPMGCSLLCSSVHGIFQARVLESLQEALLHYLL